MATAVPTWHAIQAEVEPHGSLVLKSGALDERQPPHACQIVQSLAQALERRTEPRSDGTPEPPTWLIAPSRRIGHQWVETLTRNGHPVFNLHSTTVSALAFDVIAADLATGAHVVASTRAKQSIIEGLITAHRDAFEAFPRSGVSTCRLAKRVLYSIEALRMAGLTADDVCSALPDQMKGRDLRLLMQKYDEKLVELSLIDNASQLVRATRAISDGKIPPTIRRILLPDDLELTTLEKSLINVFRGTPCVVVEDLATDAPLPASSLPTGEQDDQMTNSPRIAAWSSKFFQSIGEANEVRAILRRCLAEQLHFDEVEIIHTDSATYPSLIREIVAALPQHEELENQDDPRTSGTVSIPVTIAEGLPVRDSRPGRALLAWMQWCRDGHPQNGLERMLREGLLRVRSDEHSVSASAIVRMIRTLHFGRGLARLAELASAERQRTETTTMEDFLAHRVSNSVDESNDALTHAEFEKVQQRCLATLHSLLALTEKLQTCDVDFTNSEGNDDRSTLLERAHFFVKNLCPSHSEFDAHSQNRLMEAITEALHWQDTTRGDVFTDSAQWLEQLPSELVVMGAGPRPGCLHVSHISSGGHSGRPYTFIIGLDEDRFPGAVTDDPVLTDRDRAELNAAHPGSDLSDARTTVTSNMDRWWKLLGRLGGQIFLGFCCRDIGEGAEMFPSPALLSLYARIHNKSFAKASDFIEAVGAPEAFVPRDASLALDETQARLAIIGPKASQTLRSVATRAHRPYLPYGQEAEDHRRDTKFTPYDGYVPEAGPLLDPCASEGREASPHSLETLGACPRRFFFRYGLEIFPHEPPLDDCDRWLSSLEAGTVLHAVLETFVRRLIERNETPSADPAQETELLEILGAELAEWEKHTPPLNNIAFESTRGELTDALLTFLKDEHRLYKETGMRPIAIEVAIGLTPAEQGTPFDSPEPVTIALADDMQLRLRGRIDRVDCVADNEGNHTYSLWDYKSGSTYAFPKAGDEDPFKRGRTLQHGLYVLMLTKRIDDAPTASLAGTVDRFGYFFPSRRGKGHRLEWSASQLSRCAELVGQLATIARKGLFLPTTDKKDCEYCKFTPVCGDPAVVTEQARIMVGASHELTTLLQGLARPYSVSNPPKRYPIKAHALALTPHTQGLTPPPDEAARCRIRMDLDTSLLVEASAGTGKTTCIVDRLIGLIASGKARPHGIVAVTFTRKAAGELRRRFREALHSEIAKGGSSEEYERLSKALTDVDSMAIGTIHSFAARLLRERAVEAGIDPGFIELDDTADHFLRERAWRAFTDSASSRHPALIADLENVGLRLGDLHFAFVSQFADYGDIDKWPTPLTSPPDIKTILAIVSPFIAKIRKASFHPPANRGTDELMTELEQLVRMFDRTDTTSLVAVMRLIEALDREPKLTQEYWPGAKDSDKTRADAAKAAAKQWKDDWDDVRNNTEAALWQWRAHRYPQVIKALMAARREYDTLRSASGALSFQDLLAKTVDLLKNSRAAREDFRKRYSHILVDEFQDTDPIQAELLLLLCSTDPAEKNPLNCVPQPGSLFVVGDPKQSLYRFRRADIVTYSRVKNILQTHGAIVELTTNFRSRSDIIDFINQVFQKEFPSSATQHSPAYVSATSGRRDAAEPAANAHARWLCGVRALRYRRSGRGCKAWAVEEARAIAEFIDAAIKGQCLVPRTKDEREKGIPFECSARDFMIVVRERAHLSLYAAALQAVGLSVDASGALGSDHADSLRTLRVCLSAVADPDDPVALLALLRGPVFGLSDAELLEYKQHDGTFFGGIDEPKGCRPELQKRCTDARAAFQRWRRWVRTLPIAAAIERIIDDAGLLLIASCREATGSSGRAVVGFIQLYLEKLRFNRETVLSINDCLDLIDDLLAKENKAQFDPVAVDSETYDRVRVMNLHKAKGLEAPVVFLCDYQMRDACTKPEDGPTLYVDRTKTPPEGWLSVARRSGNSKKLIASPRNWQTLWKRESEFDDAERIRVDYVAATRPGTALVISQFGKVKEATKRPPKPETFTAEGAWERFRSGLDLMPDLPSIGPATELDPANDEEAHVAKAAESPTLRQDIVSRINSLLEPTFSRISPREVLTEAAVGLKYSGKGRGEDWGHVVHKLLELVARSPDCDITALAEAVLSAEDFPRTYLSDAVALIRTITVSELWRESQRSPQHFSEVPFSIQVDGASLPGEARDTAGLIGPPLPTVIRGIIDRVFQDSSGKWKVIDWKTDAVTESHREKLEEHYRPQVRLYAECWRLIQDYERGRGE